MRQHELLAPAGSYDTAREVIAAGADAVYLAGTQFGARAYASNLQQDELYAILDYAHLYGRQIHLTVNTLLKNKELEHALYGYIGPLYERGLDAVIVQDFAVLRFLKQNFPGLALHASTQMSITSAAGAAFLQRAGIARIVAARELSLDEIRLITKLKGIEVESFIHGALCYSFSGQCLLSSMIGGRSGNRGRCAQPCRLAYRVTDEDGRSYNAKSPCPLSPKDLCALDLLPALCEAGVYSFKIEGRMKQAGYAAGVTGIYRKYLDLYEQDPKRYQTAEEDRALLKAYGSRSDFTGGYYLQRNGRDMLSDRDPSYTASAPSGVKHQEPEKIPVCMQAVIKSGEPLALSVALCNRPVRVRVKGEVVSVANKRPLQYEETAARLKKTGGTPYAVTGLALVLDADAFLPVRALNEVRRKALARLQEEMLTRFRRSLPSPAQPAKRQRDPKRTNRPAKICTRVMIAREDMLQTVLEADCVDEILLDLYEEVSAKRLLAMAKRIRQSSRRAVFCFPYIFRRDAQERFVQAFAQTPADLQSFLSAFDAYLVRSYDSLGYLLSCNGVQPERIETDYNLYIFSEMASEAFRACGIGRGTLSPELNGRELKHQDRDAELILYGYQPVMISAQCIYKNYRGCRLRPKKGEPHPADRSEGEAGSRLYLKEIPGESTSAAPVRAQESGIYAGADRTNTYAVRAACRDCYNVIYGAKPLYLCDKLDEIREAGYRTLRLSFVYESTQDIRRILSDYACRQEISRQAPPDLSIRFEEHYTRGHYNRGVE